MTAKDISQALSREAKATLINFGNSRAGTAPPRATPDGLMDELRWYRLVSAAGNLTVRGGMVRDYMINRALEAF